MTSRLLLLVSSLVLTACSGTARQVYRVDADRDVDAAVFEAASKLGYEPQKWEDGSIRLQALPAGGQLRGTTMSIRTLGDQLQFEGFSAAPDSPRSLGAVPRLITTATNQQLGISSDAPRVESRSRLATLGIDLVAPWAGTLYVFGSNPYRERYGLQVAAQAIFDVLFIAATVVGAVNPFGPEQRQNANIVLGVGVGGLAVMRVVSMVSHLMSLHFRNALAESGYGVPLQLPRPIDAP